MTINPNFVGIRIFKLWNSMLNEIHVICIIRIITDTDENVQKWTRVFSTRRLVLLVARTCRKKGGENSVSTFGRFRLWTSFESSPVSVDIIRLVIMTKRQPEKI